MLPANLFRSDSVSRAANPLKLFL